MFMGKVIRSLCNSTQYSQWCRSYCIRDTVIRKMNGTNTFPYFTEGVVVKGFGRGSKELGIPTANFSDEIVDKLPAEVECGVYYGWASVQNGPVHGMVMSVGWNPFYKNTKRTMETHILYDFKEDFYGSNLKVCISGFIRPMRNFTSVDELISEIKNDISQAKTKLKSNLAHKEADFFKVSNSST